jgi:hypothetical protein
LGLEKPNSSRDRGETFFPNSGSDLDSDETFQISRNVGLDIDEIVCLLDSQLCTDPRIRIRTKMSRIHNSGLNKPETVYAEVGNGIE